MLISGGRAAYGDGRLRLPDWVRAPLAINNGARCFVAFEPPKEHRRRCEFVVATIDPSHWSDLWRIEFETRDEAGVFAALFDLLEQLKIHVVSAEASIHSLQERNATSIIVSCTRYQDRIDGNSAARTRNPEATLRGLENLIALNFLDLLTVNYRGHPRVKVRRMDALYRIKDAVNSGRLPAVSNEILSDGVLTIPRKFHHEVTQLGEQLLESTSVDTKNRIVRILVWPKEEPLGHMQFFIPDNPTAAARRLFQVLLGLNANVLKYQIRPGPNKLVAPSVRIDRHDESGFRLDITFEALRGELEKIVEVAARKVGQDTVLRASGVKLLVSRIELSESSGPSHEV